MAFVWSYPAVVDRVVDGDTLDCHVQFSAMEEAHGVNVRVQGINAVELRTTFGKEALAFAATMAPPGTAVTLIHNKRDKFGRLLAHVILPDGSDLGTHLLTALASDGVTHLAIAYLT